MQCWRSLGREDPVEKGLVTHASVLAWRIPWTEELGRLQSMGSQRFRHDWATHTFTHIFRVALAKWISCEWSESCSVMSDSWWPHGLYSPWDSPGQNTEVGSLSLLQGIFPAQGSNQGLLHRRRILHQLSYQGISCMCTLFFNKLLSCVQLFAAPWSVAHQAPPSTGFPRQECWSGLPFPSPCVYMHPLFFAFRSRLGHHRARSGDLCARHTVCSH